MKNMNKRFLSWGLVALAAAAWQPVASFAQQPPAGPPPSVANEPPPEPGADELNAAARKGDVAAVKALLDKGISPDAKWRYGMTALFPACDRGYVEIVKLLLERGAKADVRDRFYGQTPFQIALDKGHAEIVQLLFEKGTGRAEDVLYAGVEKGKPDMVKLALGRGGMKPESLTGALLQATRAKRAEIVDTLKAAGAMPPSWNMDEPSLAYFAGAYGDGGVIRIELKDGGLIGVGGGQPFHLFPIADNTFKVEETDGLVIVFQTQEGAVTGMLLKQGSRETPFKKVEVKK